MKKFLERNLNKQAQELMEMQGLLRQYDHENKELNRQVLKLLQENTRLKMEKVQNNIINVVPPQAKPALQKICSKHLQEYQASTHQKSKQKDRIFDENSKIKPPKISVASLISKSANNKPSSNPTNLKNQGLLEQNVFFTFGTAAKQNDHPNVDEQSPSSSQVKKDEVSHHFKALQQSNNQEPQIKELAVAEHRDALNRRGSLPNKLRTVHSIRPSPQITPQRSMSRMMATPSKSIKQDHSEGRGRVWQSTQKKKRYIEVISVFLTPSKSNKMGKQCSDL